MWEKDSAIGDKQMALPELRFWLKSSDSLVDKLTGGSSKVDPTVRTVLTVT